LNPAQARQPMTRGQDVARLTVAEAIADNRSNDDAIGLRNPSRFLSSMELTLPSPVVGEIGIGKFVRQAVPIPRSAICGNARGQFPKMPGDGKIQQIAQFRSFHGDTTLLKCRDEALADQDAGMTKGPTV